MKAKKVLKVTGLTLLVVLIVGLSIFGIGAWQMFGDKVKAAQSVHAIGEDLYYLEYQGDYGFDAFLQQGGAASDAAMGTYIATFLSGGMIAEASLPIESAQFGCSALSVQHADSGMLFGRNFDFSPACRAIIVHTIPENGYESYSTSNLNFLGFGEGWKPEGMQNQYMALAAIYVPLDGMNEKGLCVADLICGDAEETHQQTERADLTIVSAIRLLLDKAANVDEAIALLAQYDINSSIGTSHHLAIADAAGKAVVVEWINNEMIVTETAVVTNHYLSAGEKYGVGNEESHARYAKLLTAAEKNNYQMNTDALRDMMQSVSYDAWTQWSIVYHQQDLALDFYWQHDFATPHRFTMQGATCP